MVLSSSQVQGIFEDLQASKPKAKNLTFEAKATDFKLCFRERPRGQGRPQRLKPLVVTLFPGTCQMEPLKIIF